MLSIATCALLIGSSSTIAKFWLHGATRDSKSAMTLSSASTVSTRSRTRSRQRSGGNGNGPVGVASAAMEALTAQMEALPAQRGELTLGGDGPTVGDGDGDAHLGAVAAMAAPSVLQNVRKP